jgi:hypothetical protein
MKKHKLPTGSEIKLNSISMKTQKFNDSNPEITITQALLS